MSTRPVHPTARALLVWMSRHPERLHARLNAEAHDAEDLSPAGDPAVRAHLCFVAEALAAGAAASAPELTRFADELPELLRARGGRVEQVMGDVGAATAFELGKQFGSEAGEDPSTAAMVDRRVRIGAWTRVFLEELDAVRAPAPAVGPDALDWMAERQGALADTIFAMDRRAKEGEMARVGPQAVDDPDVANRIGQAAVVQAHTRFLVEALAACLTAPTAER